MSGVTLTIQPAEVFLNFTAPAVSLNIEANTVNLSINPAVVTLDLGAQTVNLEISSPNVDLSIGSPAVSLHISCYGGIGPGGIGHVIQDDGTPMTQRANLNFVGATVTDDAGNDATVVTITGGGVDTSFTVEAGEDLAAGTLIYIASDGLAYMADNTAQEKEAVTYQIPEQGMPEPATTFEGKYGFPATDLNFESPMSFVWTLGEKSGMNATEKRTLLEIIQMYLEGKEILTPLPHDNN